MTDPRKELEKKMSDRIEKGEKHNESYEWVAMCCLDLVLDAIETGEVVQINIKPDKSGWGESHIVLKTAFRKDAK